MVIINLTFVLWDTGWTGAAGYPSHQLLQVGCWHFVSKLAPTGGKKKQEKEKKVPFLQRNSCIIPSEFTQQPHDQDHHATVRPGRSRAPFLYERVHRTSWMEWDYRHVEVLQSSPDDKKSWLNDMPMVRSSLQLLWFSLDFFKTQISEENKSKWWIYPNWLFFLFRVHFFPDILNKTI